MNYYLAEQGQAVGPFSREQLVELYQTGQLAGETPCCMEGQASWESVAVLIGGSAPVEAAAPALPSRFEQDSYVLRRKVLKLFGASFHVFGADGSLIFFSNQKAFKLREDIRVYGDEAMTDEVLSIQARQIIDFSAAYDVVDSKSGMKVGAFRRKGFTSLIRDAWQVLDVQDNEIGQIQEDNLALALIRRFILAIIPQRFHLSVGGQPAVNFQQQFNPFIYKLEIRFLTGGTLDRRLGLAAAVLLAAIEGRQQGE